MEIIIRKINNGYLISNRMLNIGNYSFEVYVKNISEMEEVIKEKFQDMEQHAEDVHQHYQEIPETTKPIKSIF